MNLAHNLLRILVGQETDIEIVGTAVGDAVQDVAADDARQVHARVGEQRVALAGEGQLGDAAVVVVGHEDGVLAEPGRRAVGALAVEGDAKVEHAL
jgi:hypothetical protein